MLSRLLAASEMVLLLPLAFVVSWAARTTLRVLARRAVRRAQRLQRTSWRARLDRLGDDGKADARRRQRADSVARLLGHIVTIFVFGVTGMIALNLAGVDAAFAISSAGFIGFAIAISAQDAVKDFLAGIRVLLEDRYAVGDEVTFVVGGNEVSGTVDLIGAAAVRLRTTDGTTWHAGHHAIESVANRSQVPAVTDIAVSLEEWNDTDAAAAAARLVESSNDVGLTGIVFVRDIETHVADPAAAAAVDAGHPAAEGVDRGNGGNGGDGANGSQGAEGDTVTVAVKANRPLTAPQTALVRDRLLGH